MSQPCTWSSMNTASTLFARAEPGQHGSLSGRCGCWTLAVANTEVLG